MDFGKMGAIVGAFALVGFIGVIGALQDSGGLTPPPTTGQFSADGTIMLSKNSTGDFVPYFVYTDSAGKPATKALVFNANSECVTVRGTYPCPLITQSLDAYYGDQQVAVVGSIDQEHVVVGQIKVA